MVYELKDWKQNGSLSDNGDGTSSQPIMMWIGIVDDTKGFEQTKPTVVIFPSTDSIEKAKDVCTAAAVKFVDENYNAK